MRETFPRRQIARSESGSNVERQSCIKLTRPQTTIYLSLDVCG
uniref:Uncharacterized protein n=1 Tax=Utricularia reniformis TaxID=192314 RepID=A0A1Y0B485_9LAMI|nr:hypothetical protein AEK19_MT2112 [Utricularia reniformis]ART32265.1 hypothetical protein AEK19_MT2112 [Utricularia reniformis]